MRIGIELKRGIEKACKLSRREVSVILACLLCCHLVVCLDLYWAGWYQPSCRGPCWIDEVGCGHERQIILHQKSCSLVEEKAKQGLFVEGWLKKCLDFCIFPERNMPKGSWLVFCTEGGEAEVYLSTLCNCNSMVNSSHVSRRKC
jgi:hypothetical protein